MVLYFLLYLTLLQTKINIWKVSQIVRSVSFNLRCSSFEWRASASAEDYPFFAGKRSDKGATQNSSCDNERH